MTVPTIAIVGRPNVGKSTFFNRLAGEKISIVEDLPGVTRDRIYAESEWLGKTFNIIDTGGIEINDEPFMEQIKYQVAIAIEEADLIIMLTSAKEGLTDTDEYIAKRLHRSKKPVLLAVNKTDNPELRNNIYEFYNLGLGDPYPVSSSHGLGIGDLLDEAFKLLPDLSSEKREDVLHFSFIGRPNVGKSSLVNALLGEERVIVSNEAGTTRDAVDVSFKDEEDREYIMIDTAGLRKKGKVDEKTEKYSALRSMRAIERSDVVIVVLNAEEGIREYDKRIAGFAHEAGKGILILVNKWDTLKKDTHSMKEFEDMIRQEFKYLDYAPILFVSAKTKQRIHQIPNYIQEIYANQHLRLPSSLLNDVLMDAIAMNPTPTDKGKRLKIFYCTQVAVAPPTFVVFVNEEELLHFSYARFLENQIRKIFPFEGTSIRILPRRRK